MSVQLHHFCDASEEAYAAVSYIRIEKADGTVHASFIYGKAKLSPLKSQTIPRLELIAAVLAVENDLMIKNEMGLVFNATFFWSDSMVVLGQIKSEDGKFPTFVHRRVTDVRQASDPEQWRYVPTDMNPADITTRGATELDQWLSAPLYLLANENTWPESPGYTSVTAAVVEETRIPKEDNMADKSYDQQQPGQVNGEVVYTRSHDPSQDGCQETESSPSEDTVSSLAATTKEVRKYIGYSTTDLSKFIRNPTDVFMHSFSSWFKLR